METKQLPLPHLAEKTPEEIIRENLIGAMIRYRGDAQTYYKELLKKLPAPPNNDPWRDLQRVAEMRLSAFRR